LAVKMAEPSLLRSLESASPFVWFVDEKFRLRGA